METKESLRERGEQVEETCSKLISLAQIFQEREKRETQLKERLRNVESRAENDIERLQVQFSTSRKSEQQLKDENAELRRKLSKTRKKLEEESNERHRIEAEMKQRRGPVSYINQLHTSSLSSDKHGRSSEHSSRHRGKENSGRRKDDRNYS
jgi:arginine/lysine/ornithine decarboxylase